MNTDISPSAKALTLICFLEGFGCGSRI